MPLGSLALIFGGMLCLSEAGVIVKWIPRSDPLWTNAVAMLTAAILLIVGSLVAYAVETFAPQFSTAISAFFAGGICYFLLGAGVAKERVAAVDTARG